MPLSKNQIRQLGKRLRDADQVSSTDLALLGQLLSRAQQALAVVEQVLPHELGMHPVTRVKTTSTLVDKLRRSRGSNLDTVQDLAGHAWLFWGGLHEQNGVGERIQRLFPDGPPKVVDRRAQPSFGHRALHVVVFVESFPVEIQLRTPGQDRWAQLMERIGDEWGRNVRYGGEPLPTGDQRVDRIRRLVLETMMKLSGDLARDESLDEHQRQVAPVLRDPAQRAVVRRSCVSPRGTAEARTGTGGSTRGRGRRAGG